MRLIDADAFGGIVKDGGELDEHATIIARDAMFCMPTVDAVPVRHGKWILDEEFIDCSECRREKWSRVPYESLVKRFKYCPNCGARMDEE